jgi:transposase
LSVYRALLANYKDIDFLKLSKTAKNSRARIRCLAVHHFLEGRKVAEICRMLKRGRQAIYNWLERLAKGGVERLLTDEEGAGMKRRLNVPLEDFQKAVLQLQEERSGGRLRARDIQALIRERWGVDYVVDAVYTVLKRYKMSWVTGRSRHPKADPDVQEAYKKTLPLLSPKPCPPRSPLKTQKSGSRTKPAWDNKVLLRARGRSKEHGRLWSVNSSSSPLTSLALSALRKIKELPLSRLIATRKR